MTITTQAPFVFSSAADPSAGQALPGNRALAKAHRATAAHTLGGGCFTHGPEDGLRAFDAYALPDEPSAETWLEPSYTP